MARYVIVGAGSVGTHTARLAAAQGHDVVLLSRSGRQLDLPGVISRSVDASDPRALTAAVGGAQVLYNCANPGTYIQWRSLWPPLAAALLHASRRTGAVLATVSNLYGYGPVHGPLTTEHPLAAT
ncbi:NAD(P)H-binding protein [Nesterenkonia flava]|uniref:NAD(P)H-binding protein n=1 Tax=Nesterenkonia flava TaxID=469799 RepID=A0ABU1FRA6_9MICC|nr:NAD(P)H-binding protein [Nesterenkonia flava]MDR5711179.1 NAD(P)H-binding protein [Nesterenkonia flava]